MGKKNLETENFLGRKFEPLNGINSVFQLATPQ